MKNIKLAVVGATGVVGRTVLKVLEEKELPISKYEFFASKRSAGMKITFLNEEYIIQELTTSSFDSGFDFAIFCAGSEVSKIFAPIAVSKGCIVIDNSSYFRMDINVPLIVPEVNAEEINNHHGIIANPNCSTIQALVALKPLDTAYNIKRIVYSTYQAVSGAGYKGITDLKNGILDFEKYVNNEEITNLQKNHSIKYELNHKLNSQLNCELNHKLNNQLNCKLNHKLNNQLSYNLEKFPQPIFSNCLPHIDVFLENGYTKEEEKMINETRKILKKPDLRITATTVRVPVFNSHSESINVEFEKDFSMEDLVNNLKNAPGIVLKDDTKNEVYPTTLDANNQDKVFVGRVRRDYSVNSGINLWVVADNVRKGAASNAVQILEKLI